MIDADGRLVTPSFVDAHIHLDKVYTLPLLGDRAIEAYTGEGMAGATTAIEMARAVRTGDYRRETLLPSIRRALHEAVRYGTLHMQAFVDVDTAAGLEGLHAVLAARAEFRDVSEISVVAFPQDGLLRDPGAADLCEQALAQGARLLSIRSRRCCGCSGWPAGRVSPSSRTRTPGPWPCPSRRFCRPGLDVALGQDDIEDAYYPYGRHNMLEVAFLASHLLDLRGGLDQVRLVDMVTAGARA
ncbi:MAG: amidohydrolase family protein [Jiangellaceae bacterium]